MFQPKLERMIWVSVFILLMYLHERTAFVSIFTRHQCKNSKLFKLNIFSKEKISQWWEIDQKDIPMPTQEQLEDVYNRAVRKEQNFLEADPYHDQSKMPMGTYKVKEPFVGKIVSVTKIVGPTASGETYDVVIDHNGKMPYWEGQSYGVIPPGVNPKNNRAYTPRLYSIASTRYGDDMQGRTATLCVRRAVYVDPATGKEDVEKKGVCSNFLCDAEPGQEIMLTGPVGKELLMPEDKPNTDLIMVATGTGVAPFRTFIRRLFVETTPASKAFNATAWLFLGVANRDSILYGNEWGSILGPNFVAKEAGRNRQFRLDYALSREETNSKGGKMYIQDKVEQYADEVFDKMANGAHIYFCGLKGMMPGILQMFESVAQKKQMVWQDLLKDWKEKGQWHVEVY